MNRIGILLMMLVFVSACAGRPGVVSEIGETVVFSEDDRQKVETILGKYSSNRNDTPGELMLNIAREFLGTPYVAHTLETGADEKMVINLREMDCTTLAENVLALMRTVKAGKHGFAGFVNELESIRYRGGVRDGYLSRLHYFSEWIYDNGKRLKVEDAAKDIAQTYYPNKVDFMSRHPSSYQVLEQNPELIDELKLLEDKVSERKAWYIPKDKLPEFENQLQNGDIIAITTRIDGLDVVHVGLIILQNGGVYMLHASSTEAKVVITSETLYEYLQNSRTATGIMVARPL